MQLHLKVLHDLQKFWKFWDISGIQKGGSHQKVQILCSPKIMLTDFNKS